MGGENHEDELLVLTTLLKVCFGTCSGFHCGADRETKARMLHVCAVHGATANRALAVLVGELRRLSGAG